MGFLYSTIANMTSITFKTNTHTHKIGVKSYIPYFQDEPFQPLPMHGSL